MAKKILLFSPPFSGHLNVLKKLALDHKNDFDFQFIITGWKNIDPELEGLDAPVKIIAHSDLNETDPAVWTLPRVAELIDECISFTKEINPDLIIYDFFSLEGNLVGKILNIPYYSSIPALIGKFTHQNYLKTKLELSSNIKAIKEIQNKFPESIDIGEIEMISDGLHIPGQINFIWSYPSLTPPDFMTNRRQAIYKFVGNLNKTTTNNIVIDYNKKSLVYISFGTVVMNNLWDQQVEMRDKFIEFIGKLADLWKDKSFNVVFVSRGKTILNKYPSNWHVVDYADQIAILSKASVFVTHAGGNSFHEAVIKHIPMIAIPFFGDQPLIAQQIERLGFGVNLVSNSDIDTKKPKNFLDESLAHKVDETVKDILNRLDEYKTRFTQTFLESENILDLLR